jgi:DNA repair protein RecN (Recombination protein N)
VRPGRENRSSSKPSACSSADAPTRISFAPAKDLATVEAIFETEDGSELIVRREITSQGRSRAFINGALATAAALKDLSNRLVELHGQHEHQQLLDPTQHLALLDAWAASIARGGRRRGFAKVRACASSSIGCAWTIASGRRVSISSSSSSASCRRPTCSAGRTRRLAPSAVAAQRRHHSAAVRRELRGAVRLGGAALVVLGRIWKRVSELAAIDPRFAPYLDARDGIKAQLDDLAFTLRDFAGGIDASPERCRQVEDRLALIERLKRKHGGTLEDAIAHRDRLAAEHTALTGGQSTVAEIEQQLADAGRKFLGAASACRSRREPRRSLREQIEASSPTWRWSAPDSKCG